MKGNSTIGLICSPGGHFVEVSQLLEAFEGHPVFFITYKAKAVQGRENTYAIDNLAKKPLSLFSAVLKILRIFARERPAVLFSTGAEIAIPCFYIGKFLFRTKLIYLECSAQVYHPSWTGRWIYPIADLFLVQWEPLVEQYGPEQNSWVD